MAERFDALLAPDTLARAWRALSTDHADWALGLPRREMERRMLLHMLELVADLRDKLVQKAAQLVLEPAAERLFHHDSFAYRPRRNVDMALALARERIGIGLHWLVDADIRGFFDNIPLKPLRARLKAFVADRELLRVIDTWLELGSAHTSFLAAPRGIAQGAILSPLFCNLYLHDLDQALAGRNLPFVRYADDFLLFAATEADARRALDLARAELARLDLQLHPDKTRVTRAGRHVQFLGQPLPAWHGERASPRDNRPRAARGK